MPNLVGTGLNQVPTNSMLGGLAYQDPEHASIKNLDLKNLSQINSEIADTAVDVFVYDTSKDSDGGAWRKRTQHTSWYNETLNTATRGSRKEFPAVAVLVLSANKLTIYDGDDPDLPMWMEVYQYVGGGNSGTTTNWHGGSGTFSAVAAINGIIICGTTGTRNLHFVNDRFSLFYSPESGNYTQRGGISNRNVAYTNWGPSDQYYAQLVSTTVNDVAMTVLPNAPVDSATGLPVPTIAVATLSGTSVIKDDGTVVDIIGFSPVHTIHIDSNIVIGSVDTSGTDYLYKTTIPSGNTTYNTDITAGSANYYMNSTGSSGTIPILRDRNVSATAYNSKDDTLYRGGNNGFDVIKAGQAVSNTVSNSLIAYLTSDYNTGWMHGDIKGAFLSDTSTTNAVGGNLIVNGTFTGNLNDWTITSSAWSLSSNRAASSASGDIYQNITTVVGEKYLVSLNFIANSSPYTRVVIDDAGVPISTTTSGVQFASFTATSTSTKVAIRAYSSGAIIDDVIVTLAEEDRSVNNKGLAVYGTVTKTAVATGADLVAYGPFWTSNYLQQPYNSELNYGTGNYYFVYWLNSPSIGSDQGVFCQGDYATGKGMFTLAHNSSGTGDQLIVGDGGGAVTIQSHENAGWVQICLVRSSGQLFGYRNGILQGSTTSTQNITSVNNSVVFGAMISNGSIGFAYSGKLSLFRTGSSAPSPEQIKKMYEDEKCLFQENAKATLHGSSDDVTALAFDDTTNLLHVGTSAGRSEFQGLRRINNTTDAVTTAISASNGLVAEQ